VLSSHEIRIMQHNTEGWLLASPGTS